MVVLGNIGGFIGFNIYFVVEKLWYIIGYGILIGFISLVIIVIGVMLVILFFINKKRGCYIEENGGLDGVVDKYGDVVLIEMGDKSFLFRYML